MRSVGGELVHRRLSGSGEREWFKDSHQSTLSVKVSAKGIISPLLLGSSATGGLSAGVYIHSPLSLCAHFHECLKLLGVFKCLSSHKRSNCLHKAAQWEVNNPVHLNVKRPLKSASNV